MSWFCFSSLVILLIKSMVFADTPHSSPLMRHRLSTSVDSEDHFSTNGSGGAGNNATANNSTSGGDNSGVGGARPKHDIVTVHPEVLPTAAVDQDPELRRLSQLPFFLPLLRSSLNLASVRDDGVERLDYRPVNL